MREPRAMRTKRAKRSMHARSAAAALILAPVFLGLVTFPQPRAFAQDRMAAATSFAQASEPPRRVPRIVVRPLPRTHPGPNSVRQCVSWLEPEYRPSGTVIVPRMHCLWEG